MYNSRCQEKRTDMAFAPSIKTSTKCIGTRKDIKHMLKFVEIERENSFGETRKAIVNVNEIVAIKEKHQEERPLYDVHTGEPTEETELRPLAYEILFTRGHTYIINEENYKKLSSVLLSLE